MNRPRVVIWLLFGLLAGALGWWAGGIVGSNMGRTVFAATSTAITSGLLARRPLFALGVGAVTAAASGSAFLFGLSAGSPLIAWPVAGLVIGLGSLVSFGRTRARVVTVVAAPLLGSVGFVLGMVATAFAGMAMSDARLAGQCLGGGAAGFGLLTIATIRVLGARLERVPAPKGGVA